MKQIEVVAAVIRKGDKIFATQRGYGEFKATRTAPLPDMNKHIQGFDYEFSLCQHL